ncbi:MULTISPECIES: SDR family NAD(P)-dependent oxidoreductase [Cylindrospermopsis]|uniref:SDR family NAD(P)-dependent oxidoreductase n=1 Tax=Cylindrospermopsis TaxID=77021 RepID=UPI001F48B0AB|nr:MULTISPECIES: SDR family NAD(P)-dependent oxidoreductase [Cylindrospermopsis]
MNNAGSARAGSFLDLDDQVFLDAWHLKVLGYIRFVRLVVPYFKQQSDGRIVNIIGFNLVNKSRILVKLLSKA